jgi:hypothetical protein
MIYHVEDIIGISRLHQFETNIVPAHAATTSTSLPYLWALLVTSKRRRRKQSATLAQGRAEKSQMQRLPRGCVLSLVLSLVLV